MIHFGGAGHLHRQAGVCACIYYNCNKNNCDHKHFATIPVVFDLQLYSGSCTPSSLSTTQIPFPTSAMEDGLREGRARGCVNERTEERGR